MSPFGPITLGELIDGLEKALAERDEDMPADRERRIYFDWCNYHPSTFHSYRGWYDHLAVTPSHEYESLTAEQFLERCKAQVNAQHHGWKGGNYVMDRETPVWVAHDGECYGTGISGVKNHGWAIILETKYFD
jgi:hypothetical protein